MMALAIHELNFNVLNSSMPHDKCSVNGWCLSVMKRKKTCLSIIHHNYVDSMFESFQFC